MPELVIRNGDVKVRVQQPSITTELAVLQGPAGRPGDKGAKGDTGPANSLAIGTVTSGDVPSAIITGEAPAQTLNLVLAKGEKGDQGPKGEPGSGSVNSVNGDLGPDIVLDAADVGASPVGHTHTASEVGASPVGHTHTPAEAGAAPAVHTHTKSQVTDFAHTHVKADVTDFAHSHTIGDLPVAASGTSNTTQVVRADDSRLSNARTPTAHTHSVSDLTATGTKDGTKFLRDDNTWAVPAGGGGGGGGPLGATWYYPATQASFSTSSTTLADVSATNLSVTFTAPASGKVIIALTAAAYTNATGSPIYWGLREGTSDVANTVGQMVGTGGDTAGRIYMHRFMVTGLVPGSAHTYKWAHRTTTGTINLLAGGSGGSTGGALMEVWSA